MPIAASDRIVARARLRVPHADAVPGFRFLIEDALATASLPAGAGLVLVRKLSLGRIAHGAGRAEVAGRMEHALRQAIAGAVHGADPAARFSPIVWFRDPTEAALVRLGDLSCDEPAPAWYWAPALPHVRADLSPAETLEALLAHLIESPEGPAALARWLAALAEAPLARLLANLPRNPGGRLILALAKIGVTLASFRSPPRSEPMPVRARRMATFQLARRAILLTPFLPGWALRLTIAIELAAAGRDPSPTLIEAEEQAQRERLDPKHLVSPVVSAPTAELGAPRRVPTKQGGLMMLVNLLAILDFPGWLAAQPEPARPALYRGLLARLGRLPRDDPQRALLRLSAAERRLLRPFAPELADWSARTRAFALDRLGLSTARIVRRAAAIEIGPAYADLFLPLAAVDIRLRRAGLDQDPGWVPWLGRIVRFHFGERP